MCVCMYLSLLNLLHFHMSWRHCFFKWIQLPNGVETSDRIHMDVRDNSFERRASNAQSPRRDLYGYVGVG